MSWLNLNSDVITGIQFYCLCDRLLNNFFSFYLFIFIGVQLLYNVVQKSESVTQIHIFPLFVVPSHLVTTKRRVGSVGYTVGSHQLSVLYRVVYIRQSQSPKSSHPCISPVSVHVFVLCICVSISALQIGSSIPFFQIPHICVNI